MDQLNIESSDLKPNPINFCIHNVWICSWQQTECYHYNKLEKIYRYVPLEIHIGMEHSILIGQKHQKVIAMPNWQPQGCKLQELFHRIYVSIVSILWLGDFLSTLFFLLQFVFLFYYGIAIAWVMEQEELKIEIRGKSSKS